MRVVVFAPHPDDELIGCGGSLVKRVSKGDKVVVVYMTSGEASHAEVDKNIDKKELVKIREREAAQGARIIGFNSLIFLRELDDSLELDERVVNNVSDIINKEEPNIVYLPNENDDHKDHKATNKIVLRALKRYNKKVRILAYEVWTPMQSFDHVEDVTEVMAKKIEAIQKHKSQLKIIRYDEAARSLARFRGLTTMKGDYCEVFKVIKIR